MTDLQAIARLKRGDIQALAILVERYQVKALRAAYLITQDRALAEDVVQATFLRVYQRIGQFDENRPFAPWFMRSVVNAAIQAAHQQGRFSSIESDENAFEAWLTDHTLSPEAALEADELRESLRRALLKLPPDQRAAVVLRYYLGMSEDEISERLDSPLGTIKWRLHAAKKQLRLLLPRKQWQEE